MKRYRTIVVDPPWPGESWWPGGGRRGSGTSKRLIYDAREPAYELMSLDAISALPIADLVENDAHLYLWIPDAHLVAGNGRRVARAWGFTPGRVILWWAKRNPGLGGFPRPAHEALLVCRRGNLPYALKNASSVQEWKQPYANGGKLHSAKPDGAYDLIAGASPGPYAELFARRARIGWDYPIGDEALGGAAA